MGLKAMGLRFSISIYALACAAWLVSAVAASAYVPRNRWTSTASGSTGAVGDPITLTWSIVDDGTNLSGQDASDLISFLDTNWGAGPGGDDLTQRPWFQYFDNSFNRWSELSGITNIYEPNDDGKRQGTFWSGSLGDRGDIRIGGADIDGPSNTLAFSYFPNNSDMVIDTADVSYLSNSSSDYRRLRNVLMHEAGHGFGMDHVVSNTSKFLLEPFISTTFDGPQFDDIRGVQAYYGDVYEKSNSGQGNDTTDLATSLGSIMVGSSVSIGTDAADTIVSSTDIDFLSIDNNTDTDFFSLIVDGPSLLNVDLTPMGPTYNQGPQGESQTSIDTSALSDLALAIFDTDGSTLLGSSDLEGLGLTESLGPISLPEAGEYYIRVMGADAVIQFYQLDLSVGSAITYHEADFDEDGDVDAEDYSIWQAAFGITASGDTDDDGDTDGMDFLTWQRQFTGNLSPAFPAIAIPEPKTLGLALFAGLFLLVRRV